MNIIHVITKEQLNTLYNQSALTWEGLSPDEENLKDIRNWLKEHKAIVYVEPGFHIIKGKFMNEVYNLTGDNAYPEELNIVSVTDIDQNKITIPRFKVGGRWFDDIVDNNLRREK